MKRELKSQVEHEHHLKIDEYFESRGLECRSLALAWQKQMEWDAFDFVASLRLVHVAVE